MQQHVDPRITPWRATVAYVAAFLAGSVTIAAITCVTWLIENGYNGSLDRHFFAATFLFPLFVAAIVSLTVLAPLLSPIYACCIVAIQKRGIRRRPAFIGLGTVFTSMGWLVVCAYRCVISTCSLSPLSSISHMSLALVIEIVTVGAASGIACRSVLLSR